MERGTRYLLTGALRALHAANARSPLARTGPASVASFAFGLPGSELPRQHMAAHAASAALAIQRGVHRSRAGKLGLALTAGAIAALWKIDSQSRDADAIVERALRDQLGDGYHDEMAESPLVPRTTELPPSRPRPSASGTSSTATSTTTSTAGGPPSTSGAGPTSPPTPRRRSFCRSTVAPGSTATRRDRPIH